LGNPSATPQLNVATPLHRSRGQTSELAGLRANRIALFYQDRQHPGNAPRRPTCSWRDSGAGL